MGLDPATVAIVQGLMELAGKIGGIVLGNRKNQIEKDKEEFYKNIKKYHERISDMLKRKAGSPKRLANDIAGDELFCFLAGHDDTEYIFRALMHAEEKNSKAKWPDRREVLKATLRVLESISKTSFA